MTPFPTHETSRYSGRPVECFRFTQGASSWYWTSADRVITLPSGVYIPEVISRGGGEFSQEDTGDTVEIRVARTNPVAALFVGEVPQAPIGVSIYRAHRAELTDPVQPFTGRVARCRFLESEAVLVGQSIFAILNRSVPTLNIQTACNHVLYSTACGANRLTSRDLVTVATVDGPVVTSSDFALRADQWFRGGTLDLAGEARLIGDHVGDTVVLSSPLPGLTSLAQPFAYWGCDHLEATCHSKFNNRVNHLGWSRLPTRNPFESRID